MSTWAAIFVLFFIFIITMWSVCCFLRKYWMYSKNKKLMLIQTFRLTEDFKNGNKVDFCLLFPRWSTCVETVEHTASQTETACLHRMDMLLQFSFFTLAFCSHVYESGLCKCASAIVFVEFLFLGRVAGIPTWTCSCERTLCGHLVWSEGWTGRAGLSGCLSSPHQQHSPALTNSPMHFGSFKLWGTNTSTTGGLCFLFFKQTSQIKSKTGETCLSPTIVNNCIFVILFGVETVNGWRKNYECSRIFFFGYELGCVSLGVPVKKWDWKGRNLCPSVHSARPVGSSGAWRRCCRGLSWERPREGGGSTRRPLFNLQEPAAPILCPLDLPVASLGPPSLGPLPFGAGNPSETWLRPRGVSSVRRGLS